MVFGTEGMLWDVVWVAVYFVSDELRWVMGSILIVDGGLSILSRYVYIDVEIS